MASQDKENKNESPQEIAQQASAQPSESENKKNKFPGFNLYVKNLDDSFTDTTLREAFIEFGTITSVKVMCDSAGNSRGFGFVCFETKEEATKALTKMNGRIVGTKPLYVSMAQRKEERKQYLSDKYKTYGNTSVLPVSPPAVAAPPQPRAAEPPPQIQYLPNNAPVPGAVQYRYLPQEPQWQTGGSPYFIQQAQPGVGAPVAYMSYQPLILVPGIGMMAATPPPPPMPILHQPIYIHNTKTNTLIYSTSVQANSHRTQIPSPGIYSQVRNDATYPTSRTTPYREAPSPQASPHFKTAANSMQYHEPVPMLNNAEDVTQQNGNVPLTLAPMQIPGNTALQFQTHSNNNFAT